ncbi:MAG TPA: ferrochelatase, partial [Mycolicibacterium fallax]|nr:ferrochelatase [Mycolicibacterium fallax]
MKFDALLLLSFGGPEGPEQVLPFLQNVTAGRGIPLERLAEVAEHYQHFGGVSPINGINRALIEQIRAQLAEAGRELPVYFGNRNWAPYLADTVAAMRDDGVRTAAVFATSA